MSERESDRELLELAAKAAGIGGGWDWPRGAKEPVCYRGADRAAWDPLTNDAQAFRLAVKLGVYIANEGMECAWASTPATTEIEPFGSDPYAATRRAIVRAAAHLGGMMP